MAITDRRIGTQLYGGKAPTKYNVYTPPKLSQKPNKKKSPKQVVAEVGDDFNALAGKLGIDTQALVTANPNDSSVKAGAAYNVPAPTPDPNAAFDVPRIPEGMSVAEWNASQNPQAPKPPRNYLKELLNLGGGDAGALPGDTINKLREWFFGNEQSSLPSGVGYGAGVGVRGGVQASPIYSPPQPQAEYADFRRAEANAAYRDREAQRMTGSLGITDIKDKPGYYGFYGTEQDLARQANGDFSKLYNPMYTPSETQTLGTKLGIGDVAKGAVAPERTLQDMWNEVYLNPENKGRGGGIPGWIEERIGQDVDWEAFYTEGDQQGVLEAMLAEFDTEELNYLESHGFIVPEEGYNLPAYGGGSYSGKYSYPSQSYYGSGGGGGYSRQTQQRYPSQIGLVSWSI